jgi:nitrogen fixation NifU-like protein
MIYSDKVRQLIVELPNRGALADATYAASAENPICGDRTTIYLKVEDEIVVASRFQCQGCPGALAAAAGLTELVLQRNIEACGEISEGTLLEYLGGLPVAKRHGVALAIEVLKRSLQS